MQKDIQLMGEKLVALFNKILPEWNNGMYRFTAIPAVNIGYWAGLTLFRKDTSALVCEDYLLYQPDEELERLLLTSLRSYNYTQKANGVVLVFEDRKFSEIKFEWDQSVQDEFDSYLPESKKGKIKAWYLPDMQEVTVTTDFKEMLAKHLAKIAAIEPAVAPEDVQEKNFEELLSLFRIYLEEAVNPLWDGGIIGLKKESDGSYSGQIVQHYAETEEERMNGNATAESYVLSEKMGSMQIMYTAVNNALLQSNPSFKWDAIYVSGYRDGFAEANFELNIETVDLI